VKKKKKNSTKSTVSFFFFFFFLFSFLKQIFFISLFLDEFKLNRRQANNGEEGQEYSGDNFAFFALSFVTCVAIPYTLSLVRARSSRQREAARKAAQTCSCAGCVSKRKAEVLAKHAKWSVSDAVKWGVCAVLWLAWIAALIARALAARTVWCCCCWWLRSVQNSRN
jgi:hypothetical protein